MRNKWGQAPFYNKRNKWGQAPFYNNTFYNKKDILIQKMGPVPIYSLNSPPVREFYEDAVIVLAIPA